MVSTMTREVFTQLMVRQRRFIMAAYGWCYYYENNGSTEVTRIYICDWKVRQIYFGSKPPTLEHS